MKHISLPFSPKKKTLHAHIYTQNSKKKCNEIQKFIEPSNQIMWFQFFSHCFIVNKFKPTILGQFIKSSNFVVNLAKKSLVSTKGTLGSALETLSEKKKNYPILRKNIKESKQITLFKKPQEKLCAFSFSRRYIETINMRKVQFFIFSIVFTEYFYHFTAWRY